MSYRRFMDSGGTLWRVWDVAPSPLDRRLAVRRIRTAKIHHPERRASPERRVDLSRSRLFFPASEPGWLCFESDVARRRLRPAPPGWVLLDDRELEDLCARAAIAEPPPKDAGA